MISDMQGRRYPFTKGRGAGSFARPRGTVRRRGPRWGVHEHYDVVVVGGRVAGAALAAHVVRRGYSALVVERAAFPSDTLSTHVFQNLEVLERLGVLDRLLATGAPLLTEFRLRMD